MKKPLVIKAIIYRPDDITQVAIERGERSIREVIQDTLSSLLMENPDSEVHFLGWEEVEEDDKRSI